MLQLLLGFINPLEKIAGKIAEVKLSKIEAKSKQEVLIHDERITVLEGRRDLLIEETKHAATRRIRPMFALPFIIYNLKIVVWDATLGWGVSDPISEAMWWVEMTIIGFYFLGRPVEKYFRGK